MEIHYRAMLAISGPDTNDEKYKQLIEWDLQTIIDKIKTEYRGWLLLYVHKINGDLNNVERITESVVRHLHKEDK